MAYDSTYFPGAEDDFSQQQKKTGFSWDGFRQITNGLRDDVDPMETLRYMEKFNGEYFRHWTFTDKRGRPMFIVARYYKDGKKEDRPFTPWTNGQETRWRSKNLEGAALPLYNLVGLEAEPNLPVLMTEGQKNAEQAREPLADRYVTTTVYRSLRKQTLSRCAVGRSTIGLIPITRAGRSSRRCGSYWNRWTYGFLPYTRRRASLKDGIYQTR